MSQIEIVQQPQAIESLTRIDYKGRPVLTTEMLARCYGTDENNVHVNFHRNADRFIEGVHFIRLTGAALKAFKDYISFGKVVSARAPSLILWTERGAARHAKLLMTDEAWEVFEKLEDSYFNAAADARSKPIAASAREATSVFRAYRSVAKLLGLDQNQSALAANRAAIKTTGVDVLATMDTTHLVAPQQEALLIPTEIGKALGDVTAKNVNLMLVRAGLQEQVAGKWAPTPAGRPFAVWQDTGKKQGDGTPVRQLKWTAPVIAILRDAMKPARASPS